MLLVKQQSLSKLLQIIHDEAVPKPRTDYD